jgi:hypothetical protein
MAKVLTAVPCKPSEGHSPVQMKDAWRFALLSDERAALERDALVR